MLINTELFELEISIRSTVLNIPLREWSEGKKATSVAFVTLKMTFSRNFMKNLHHDINPNQIKH